MAQRTSGEREQFWRDLIGRQPSSGLSIASFCDQAGVSANSFFVWKSRLRSRATAVKALLLSSRMFSHSWMYLRRATDDHWQGLVPDS